MSLQESTSLRDWIEIINPNFSKHTEPFVAENSIMSFKKRKKKSLWDLICLIIKPRQRASVTPRHWCLNPATALELWRSVGWLHVSGPSSWQQLQTAQLNCQTVRRETAGPGRNGTPFDGRSSFTCSVCIKSIKSVCLLIEHFSKSFTTIGGT